MSSIFHHGNTHIFGTKTGDDDPNIYIRAAAGQTLNIEANLVDPLGAVLTNLSITDTTESTSKLTGALKVAGGIGTNKTIFCNALDCENVLTAGAIETGIINGEWNGTTIDPYYGGTGVNNGARTITLGGNLTTTDAITIAATATANRILITSSANNIGLLTTANNGVLITSGAGVPSISSTLPTATQDNITRTGTITSGTWSATNIGLSKGGTGSALNATNGTVLCVASGVGAQTAAGTTGQFMLSAGTGVPTWSNTVPNAISVTNATASSSVSTGSIINSGGIGNSGRVFTNDLTCVNSIVGKNIYATITQIATVNIPAATVKEIFSSSNGTFSNATGGFTYNSSTGRLTISETGIYSLTFYTWHSGLTTSKYTENYINIVSGGNVVSNRVLGLGADTGTNVATVVVSLTSGNVLLMGTGHTETTSVDISSGVFRIAKVVA